MPFVIRKQRGKWCVVGPYRAEKEHVYGCHDSLKGARRQQAALYVNNPEARTVIKKRR